MRKTSLLIVCFIVIASGTRFTAKPPGNEEHYVYAASLTCDGYSAIVLQSKKPLALLFYQNLGLHQVCTRLTFEKGVCLAERMGANSIKSDDERVRASNIIASPDTLPLSFDRFAIWAIVTVNNSGREVEVRIATDNEQGASEIHFSKRADGQGWRELSKVPRKAYFEKPLWINAWDLDGDGNSEICYGYVGYRAIGFDVYSKTPEHFTALKKAVPTLLPRLSDFGLEDEIDRNFAKGVTRRISLR